MPFVACLEVNTEVLFDLPSASGSRVCTARCGTRITSTQFFVCCWSLSAWSCTATVSTAPWPAQPRRARGFQLDRMRRRVLRQILL